MGWSLPEIPEKVRAPVWSPWIALSIIITGIFIGLMIAVMKSPVSGLPSLNSGYWLPLSGQMLSGIALAVTVYSFWWECVATSAWNWNEWCRDMRLRWYKRAHEHLVILYQVFISADAGLLSRITHTENGDDTETPSLTLLPDEPLTPGISRFEQILCHLFSQIKSALLQRYPSGKLHIVVQTSGTDKEREFQSFNHLWTAQSLPWEVSVHLQKSGLSVTDWNQIVGSINYPVLILSMHYRQPDELLPEFASALFLVPPDLLRTSEQKNALRLFRAMPLNTSALVVELSELQYIAQQPANKKYLVWHTGLTGAVRQSMNRVLSELPLSLYEDIGVGGVIDYESVCVRYNDLDSWSMVATAAEIMAYGPTGQWLLLTDEKGAWAVTLENSLPIIGQECHVVSPPFPGGSIMLALLLTAGLFHLMARYFSSVLFSWWGVIILVLFLAIILPGVIFGLRSAIAYIQRPLFILAARQS